MTDGVADAPELRSNRRVVELECGRLTRRIDDDRDTASRERSQACARQRIEVYRLVRERLDPARQQRRERAHGSGALSA